MVHLLNNPSDDGLIGHWDFMYSLSAIIAKHKP